MILVYILLLIPLTTATRRFDGPSYRSNVMEGDKPILRMGPDPDFSESDNSDEYRQPSPPIERKAPESAKNMNRIVNWLVEHFSYDLLATGRKSIDGLQDKPVGLFIESHNENENYDPYPASRESFKPEPNEASKENDESDTALREGDNPVTNEPSKENRSSDESDTDHDDDAVLQKPVVADLEKPVDPLVETSASKETGLRSHKKKRKEEKGDPDWIIDLKAFIKDLTTQYGQQEVLDKTKPVIASLEKKHHMKIKDIDVDEYGEIHITYIEKGKSKKTTRKGKHTDR